MTIITTETKAVAGNKFAFKPGRITASDIAVDRLDKPDIPLPPYSKRPTEILDIDQTTPDNHVARDPRLLRLTGVHPFNSEPPLTPLFKEGFLTSLELFYVRNHGPVPYVRDEDIPTWELSIEGLVERPLILTFKHVLQMFDQVTVPITLVCAGNRRKEQNMVRKSKGFSWGSAGLSTALFTGPLMADVLATAKPLRQARYLCMEGADNLPNGHYGTSIKLNWAMDPNRGIMLAHKMNGEPLRPDHGRPLRAVVPGQIGGRSVKWLKRLILTDTPSDNWYHINDNRVLPTMVSPEMAAQEPKWWRDERHAIYDLNVNSVAVYPQHEEHLDLLSSASSTYSARGYAYAGGGRRITRVEISLDKAWRLADIEYAEDKYRDFKGNLFGGKVDMWWRETCFCWCLWTFEIAILDLENSDAILIRAVDEALATQPRDMYWSVLGMMNNPWFRISITRQGDHLIFEHPTHPTKSGGWMEKVKKAGGDLTNGNWGEHVLGKAAPEPAKEINMRRKGLNRQICLLELKENTSTGKPWFIVNGEVYDGTGFLEDHPGGAASITASTGLDVSEDFLAIHSETAKALMQFCHIGTMDKASLEALNTDTTTIASDELKPVFLRSQTWTKMTLVEKRAVSPDTRVFRFQLEHDKQTLGLPIGQHLMIKLLDPSATNGAIIRSYTPISDPSVKGQIELLIKIYFQTDRIPGGKMTTALDKIAIGSKVDCTGPTGRFRYLGNGRVAIGGKERKVRSFKMVCGGTGITPIFQVVRAIIQDHQDPTSCVVLDGNRSEGDILCWLEFDSFVKADPRRCSVVHTLTSGSDRWKGYRGRISGELLRKYAAMENECMVLICGPEAMERSVRKLLLEQGWAESDLFFF